MSPVATAYHEEKHSGAVRERIERAVKNGLSTADKIARATGVPRERVNSELYRLREAHRIAQSPSGHWYFRSAPLIEYYMKTLSTTYGKEVSDEEEGQDPRPRREEAVL